MLLQRDKMNFDKIEDIKIGLKQMPVITDNGASHSYPNSRLPTRLPKNMILDELKVNEKFLNKYQSLIEDNLPKKQLEQFVEYQNWNFKYGMGETKRNRHLYVDTTELTKENLFSGCKCKEKTQLEKVVRESLMGVDNFGVFPNNWSSLIPQKTNFSYQTLVTFSNASLNRGGCVPSGEIGNANSGSNTARGCKTNYFTRYGSSISGTLTADLIFNAVASRWESVASGALNSTTYQCMYDTDNTRVGSGTQDPYNLTAGVTHYSETDEFCTLDATIRSGMVNTSTSCSDAGNQKTGATGITGFLDAINSGDENQLKETAGFGTGENSKGASNSFKHTDA